MLKLNLKNMRSLLIILIFILPLSAFSQEDGKTLFRNYCAACHSVETKLVGPALKDVEMRRDSAWIYNFVKSSQAMINEGDSLANALFLEFNQVIMPDQPLKDDQIAAVLDFIEVEGSPKTAAANPIARPTVDWGTLHDPFRFDNFKFWIPFTVTVFILIYLLYYMTVLTDIARDNMEKKEE